MDATQPVVTKDGKPTRLLMQAVDALRTLSTDPNLSADTVIVDSEGKPTRPLIVLMGRLTGFAPKAGAAIVDPRNGYPTRHFLAMVNP